LSGNRRRAARGVTLIEMAVALFVIALLLGSIIAPLQTQVETRKYDETQKILEQARDALLGYAAAYGYLPCPADYALGSAGSEAAGSTHTSGTGTCPATVTGGGTSNVMVGYLPAVTLGFTPTDSSGYAVDGWGIAQNRIRYAVYYNTTAANRFTNANGMRNTTMGTIIATTMLSVCTTATGSSATGCASAATTLTSNAVAVIWSLGPNAATTGGTSTDEAENAEALASVDRVWVKKDKTGGTGAEFDDVVIWISPALLFNRLIAAGQLP